MDERNDLEEQLKEIAGGTFGEDAVYSLRKFNNPAAIKQALNTNICPLCSQQVVPDAKTCDVEAFFGHLHSKHPDL